MTTDVNEIQSDYLFARPSLIEGVARMVDFGGSLNAYNNSATGAEADERAMLEDWKAVGRDLRVVLDQLSDGSDEPQ